MHVSARPSIYEPQLKGERVITLCFQCGLTEHLKQKDSVINTSAITAVIKSFMKRCYRKLSRAQ